MTFTQALALIETLLNQESQDWDTIGDLLDKHADSIVQLAKVAAEMRSVFAQHPDFTSSYDDVFYAALAYDKLMKGEE